MAKRGHKRRKQESKLNALLSDRQKTIVRLNSVVNRLAAENDRKFAGDLIAQYNKYGRLSDKQWWWAAKLCQRPKHSPPAEYCLYGIKAGDELKIGMSNDPEKRAKGIQTGNPNQVKVVWIHRCGSLQKARAQEKKLHRYCKEHWIRGEWFTLDALDKLRQWRDRAQGTSGEVMH